MKKTHFLNMKLQDVQTEMSLHVLDHAVKTIG